jgi:putative NADPH-quinone reductase
MLKGFFDRVFMPGVAFDLSDPARVQPLLGHIRRVAGISTYGRPRLHPWYVGGPPRRLVTRYLRWFVARSARVDYHALSHLNVATGRDRRRFLDRIEQAMREF